MISDYPIAKTITVSGVEIDIAQGPIGISASGGADSSLLLYILLSNHPGPIHAFTCVSEEKHRGSGAASQRVVQRCIELTGNDNIIHHMWYVKRQDNDQLVPLQMRYQQLGIYGLRYVGVTADPPADVSSRFLHPTTETAWRDPLVTRDVHLGDVYRPFTNIDKREIARLYAELGLLDTLFPVTRSCESTSQGHDHCGTCWWCEERYWAFGRLV